MIETVSLPRYYTIPGLKNKQSLSSPERDKQKANKIIRVVCDYLCISPDEIKKRCRKADVTYARHFCIYLIRKNTGITLKQIGNFFYENMDHTTVIHGSDAIKDQLELPFDNKYKADMSEILKLLNI